LIAIATSKRAYFCHHLPCGRKSTLGADRTPKVSIHAVRLRRASPHQLCRDDSFSGHDATVSPRTASLLLKNFRRLPATLSCECSPAALAVRHQNLDATASPA